MSMLSSIGPSRAAASIGGAQSGRGILQTQLARYEVQLADWCHCPSGKTADGKAKIAEIQQEADAAKAQIKQIDDARGPSATGSRIDVYA